MAGLDLGTASRYIHQLQRPDLHLRSESEDDNNNGNNDHHGGGGHYADHHQQQQGGLDLVAAAAMGPGDIVARRPRGRPPGSKNKPKPPVVIMRDGEAALRPVVLEMGPGSDVVEQIVDYALRRRVAISVLSGCGTVSSVVLRHPMAHAPTLSLHGPLNIVCLSGTCLGAPTSTSTFSVSLAGSQGQVFGGIIGGKMTAQTPVVVVATTFVSPPLQRLPGCGGGGDGEGLEADNKVKAKTSGSGGAGVNESGGSGSGGGMVTPPPGMYSVGGQTQAAAAGVSLNGQISAEMLDWGGSVPVGGRPHRY